MRLPTERTWRHGARAITSLSVTARLRICLWISESDRGGVGGHAPLHIDRAEVEKDSCFKLLCVFIKDDLTWSRQADSAIKAAQKCLYFLRKLKKFGMSAKTLINFYRCTIESFLFGCITAWFDSCSTADRKALQRVVKTVERIIGCHLPAVQSIYHTCLRKAQKIIEDYSHPGHGLFTLLPSGRHYWSIQARTTRLKNKFLHTHTCLIRT